MKITVLLAYANPHVTGWLDEFINRTEHEVIVGIINSVKKYRNNYFKEVDEKTGYLYFFKGEEYKTLFYSHVKQCDFLITLGIFEPLFIKAVYYLKSDAKVFVLCETYNPYNRKK